jgi:hypothetical protein
MLAVAIVAVAMTAPKRLLLTIAFIPVRALLTTAMTIILIPGSPKILGKVHS